MARDYRSLHANATLDTHTLDTHAHATWRAALKAVGYSHTREQLRDALYDMGQTVGLTGGNLRAVISRGLAWSGYGGGI